MFRLVLIDKTKDLISFESLLDDPGLLILYFLNLSYLKELTDLSLPSGLLRENADLTFLGLSKFIQVTEDL